MEYLQGAEDVRQDDMETLTSPFAGRVDDAIDGRSDLHGAGAFLVVGHDVDDAEALLLADLAVEEGEQPFLIQVGRHQRQAPRRFESELGELLLTGARLLGSQRAQDLFLLGGTGDRTGDGQLLDGVPEYILGEGVGVVLGQLGELFAQLLRAGGGDARHRGSFR